MGIKLQGVNLGYFGLDYDILVAPNPNNILNKGRQQGPRTWYQCPSISYIIDHPEGKILFETGVSPSFKDEWLQDWQDLIDLDNITPEVCLEGRLKGLGLAPEDFAYVIQGHLHCDHAGGLRLFEDAGVKIVVHEDEYRYAQSVWTAENFFVREDWGFLSRQPPFLMYGDQELLPDLWTLSLPGHTPGTMGILLRLDTTGWVLLTTDALYTHDSYGPPPVGSPITMLHEQWAQSNEKIQRIATEKDAFIFPGHSETGIQFHQGEVQFKPIDFRPGHIYE